MHVIRHFVASSDLAPNRTEPVSTAPVPLSHNAKPTQRSAQFARATVNGSMVKLKQGGQIAHVSLPARVTAITEYNALFFSDGNMSIVPLAWLEVVL
jgi:hypothetical protein